MTKEETDDPLVNMTWGYIQFAQDEPQYFQMMFADTTPGHLPTISKNGRKSKCCIKKRSGGILCMEN
ncbi:MAG: WHG domain-containing protein [Spartobacteria bacterium]|nr:WHG domain-containing protein [Spartobacteria bacterium]